MSSNKLQMNQSMSSNKSQMNQIVRKFIHDYEKEPTSANVTDTMRTYFDKGNNKTTISINNEFSLKSYKIKPK
jgi:hypothetical protein